MSAKRLVQFALAAALVAAACLASVAQAAPTHLIALGAAADRNTLFSFSGEVLKTVTVVPVTGVDANTLVGISFRPAGGALYGLGMNGNVASLFTIDPETGAATLVGSATSASGTLGGASKYGIDFNPVVDRLRVVDSLPSSGTNLNNFRLNPTSGSVAGFDTNLGFGGLSGGEGANAPLATIAYDRNVAGATATTLFGITVAGEDKLVRLGGVDGNPSPNGGALAAVGPLGVDTTLNAALDIDPISGEAYAVLQVGGASGLFRINLGTGAATPLGPIGSGATTFAGLAIAPPAPPVVEPGPSPSQPPPGPSLSPQPSAVALSSLKLTPSAFVAALSGPTIAAAKATSGSKVTYVLSGAATVSFRVERPVPGRRGKFTKLKGTFSRPGKAGGNSFRFSGRIGGKALSPGRYRLSATVGGAARTATFKILPPAR